MASCILQTFNTYFTISSPILNLSYEISVDFSDALRDNLVTQGNCVNLHS